MVAALPPITPADLSRLTGLAVAGKFVSLRFFVPGEPVAKGRPRTKVVTPKEEDAKPYAQIYTDEDTKTWEETIAWIVRGQVMKFPQTDDDVQIVLPFEKRILVALRFNLEKGPSVDNDYPITSRKDVDNLAKAVLDALQKARIIKNDNRVTDLSTSKRYASAEHPVGVEIEVLALW